MGASIWGGVLQSGALQKNRFQLKTGAGGLPFLLFSSHNITLCDINGALFR